MPTDLGDGGPATSAALFYPMDVAVDDAGNLYIADYGTGRVRKVDAQGIITTFAGGGFGGDGPATDAELTTPRGVAVDLAGNVYVTEMWAHRVRKVGADGTLVTIAGSGGTPGYGGDGGPALDAQLDGPTGIAVDRTRTVYIADTMNHRVRKIDAAGWITTVAGTGTAGQSGDGGLATAATLTHPSDVAIDDARRLHITHSGPMRMVDARGLISSVTGSRGYTVGVLDLDGLAAKAAPVTAVGVALDDHGDFYAALADNAIVRARPVLPGFSGTELMVPSEDGLQLHRFSAAGKHLDTRHALTGATLAAFGYDSAGLLAQVTDGDGNTTAIERDASGKPTAIVAPHGQRTTLAVGADGYLASITNPASESTQLTYHPEGLLASKTDARGHAHLFDYDVDGSGRLIKDADPAGGTKWLTRTTPTWDSFVVRVSGETATDYSTTRLPDGARRYDTTFPNGLTTTATSPGDASTSVSYADGTTMTQASSPDPRFGLLAPLPSTTLRTPGGLVSTSSTTRSATFTTEGDPLTLTSLTETLTANGKASSSTYDAATRRIVSTSAAGRSSATTVDAKGRVVRREVPGLAPVDYAYDSEGRLSTVTQGPAPDARVTSLTYNPQGYVASITDPAGRATSFSQDLAGRVITQSLPGARTVVMAYDANGNLASLTPPGRTAHLFGFTPVDLMASYTPPDLGLGSTTTSYAYNKDRQLTTVTRPDGQTIVIGYDAGRLGTITAPTGVTTYTYSPTTGTLSSITAPGGVGLSYTWDGSLPTGTTWSGPVAGSVARTYSSDFDVTSITVAGTAFSFTRDNDRLLTGAGALTIARDPASGRVTGTMLGSVTTTRGYSPTFGELASTSASYSGTPLFATNHTRDALGRITQLVETVQGTTSTWGYEYNAAGQLWKVALDGAQVAEYQYDLNGNRVSATDELGVTTSGSYDAQDRLTSYGTATYTYTLNGELASKTSAAGTSTISYDVVGNLRSVTLTDGTAIEYVIDGENRRIGKKVNGTLVQGFLYEDQLRVVAELDGAGAVVSRFVYATRVNAPEYMVKGSTTYRIITDHLGSPRLVVDVATGTVAQRIDYDEWGNITQDTNPGFQPFGFAGGLYDQHTKLVRFGARDYDAAAGRWTTKDPILFAGYKTDRNVYSYDDPINVIDPLGQDWGIGFSIDLAMIAPFLSGGGGTVGVNFQYTSSTGFGIYLVVPTKEPSAGLLAGGSCNWNVTWGRGDWSGRFGNVIAGFGPVGGSYFQSPYSQAGTGWSGVSVGFGPSLGAGFTESYYYPFWKPGQ
jgi:RHS repeat-associated protein